MVVSSTAGVGASVQDIKAELKTSIPERTTSFVDSRKNLIPNPCLFLLVHTKIQSERATQAVEENSQSLVPGTVSDSLIVLLSLKNNTKRLPNP